MVVNKLSITPTLNQFDPQSAEIQASYGLWYKYNFNFSEAEIRFRNAIDREPDIFVVLWVLHQRPELQV